MRWSRFVVVLSLVATLAACSSSSSPSSTTTLSVTAAFYPMAFIAERIGGSALHVTNLTPPGAEPHDLELKPSDVRAIHSARVVLYLHGLQPAVDDVIRTLPNKSVAFDALSVITLRHAPDGSEDPHFWLDPTLLSKVAAVVEQRLEAVSANDAATFKSNLSKLQSDLHALDEEFRAGLSSCTHHEIFTGHAAFAYLAARYGLEQIAITGLNPEAEPSPRKLSQIIQRAKQLRPKVVFAEELVSSRSIDAVARAVHAKVEVLNPLEGLLSKEEKAGDDYFSLMRNGLKQLQQGLSCQNSP